MVEAKASGVSGVLPRAHVLLTTIALSGDRGMRLKDLSDRTGIARPTVHRMLQDLAEIGFVSQLPSRRYTLGRELYWLGLAAPQTLPSLPAVQTIASDLAEKTRDTVYVSMREAAGVRYLLRAEGDYPLQSRVVTPGELKPFTASYSGLTLLAGLSAEIRESALSHALLDPLVGEEGPRVGPELEAQLRDAVSQVIQRGWCTGPGLVMPGLSGIAVPVPNHRGMPPLLAISVSAPDTRLTPERAEQLAPLLLSAAEEICQAVAASERPAP